MNDLMARRGQIIVSHYHVNNHPEMVIDLMVGMLVLSAESRFDYSAIEYIIVSPKLEVVPDHLEAPEYQLTQSFREVTEIDPDHPERQVGDQYLASLHLEKRKCGQCLLANP